LGEPTPYHTKNSYYGQIDTAGFPKDSFYVYQAAWTDFRKKPMVHVFPYWCFNPGQLIDIRVCSNAPEVELFLNGSSLGRKKLLSGGGVSCIADYQAAYVPGELRALAYDDTGRVVAENTRSSFGDAAAILVKADKRSLMADGRDLAFIEISALDEVGRPVENATNRVSVEVRGAGRLVGLDNGDSTDYEQYKGTSRRLFSGRLLAVVASRLEAGRIDVEVSSPGLPKVSLVMEALACPRPAGVSAEMENPRSRDIDELPVRAIQIIVSGGTRMGPERKELSARAEILPVGASYSDLEWRATDDAGIDSVIAKVEAAGTEARVRALADGRFRLRCAARNGRASISLISQLEFEVEGLGQAFLDPYGFVAGGLYSLSNGELGPGNERGVATRREGESHVGFQNVDFGPFGSDEVTVPIFELNNEPLVFRVWEGMPGEDGSEMLADAVYHKKSIWGVYQEQTFKLSRRLRGVTTVCFTTDHKAHIKGFRFTRQRKAFSRLWAAENDRIYGDDFKVVGRAVFGIGNNVTLEFADMDFGPTGTTRVRIRGRSLAPKTTIHLRFSGPEGESKQIAEFEGSPGPVEMEFPLERVTGMRRLSFIFLPGSAFDFECFEFLEG
jgi:beta-galactosidase